MKNLDSILKSRDITLPAKVCIVKAMVFPEVMSGCESWTIKKVEPQRIYAFELWYWTRLLRVCLCECVGGSQERGHRRPTVQFPLGILGHGADTVPTPCCFKHKKRSTVERHIWGFVKFPLGPDFPK